MNALIVAAGEAPSSPLLIKRAQESSLMIAADNGIMAYFNADIVPDILIGDMDSLAFNEHKMYNIKVMELIKLESEKDETDTEAAINIAISRNVKKIYLLGATGLRLDHTIANLMLLKYAAQLGVNMVIEDDIQQISIKKGEFYISGEIGETISLLPVNQNSCVHAVNGLYYPLDKLMLKNDNSRGISNIMIEETVKIHSTDYIWVFKVKNNQNTCGVGV